MKITNKELHMSWYNKKSPTKHPKTPHTPPHRTSPITEKALQEAKKTRPTPEKKS